MSTLLLRLAGPLQAWGAESKFDIRQTEREPSKSGVVGLLAAALGAPRDDEQTLLALNALHFGLRVEQEGELLHDFHMARKDSKTSYLTHRYYLADAAFLVGLESEDDGYLHMLSDALRHPVFPLYLGRRSCPPTLPVVLGVRKAGLIEALTNEPWQASEWMKRRQGGREPRLRLMTDAAPDEPNDGRKKDVALSFNPQNRRYGYRAICARGFVTPQADHIPPETEHDAMRELR